METMTETYKRVAEYFSIQVAYILNTEESITKWFSEEMGGLPLDRTNHWNIIFRDLLERDWKTLGPEVKTSLTGYDVLAILDELKVFLDYNFYTQVYANLTAHRAYSYDIGAARHNLKELEVKYASAKISPFAPKAKMNKTAVTENEKIYNQDLSAIKALKILEKVGLSNSYRVSPKGCTPAFADSSNLSMIGSGGDAFLRVTSGHQIFYIIWSSAPRMININLTDGSFTATGIEGSFVSKSGGDTLNEVLFSRYVAMEALKQFKLTETYVDVLPRMNSVMILAPVGSTKPKEIYDKLLPMCSTLVYSENVRPNR